MSFRKVISTVTVVALVSTGVVPAAFAAEVRGVSPAQMHQAVRASEVRAAAARASLDQLLQAPRIQQQLRSAGLAPDVVRAQVARLSDAEIARLEAQVMPDGLQAATAGLSSGAIVAIVIAGVATIALCVYVIYKAADDINNDYYY
jgi:hypothetical protein